MEPLIKEGDELVFCPDETPKLGDVILFNLHGELTAHRLIPGGLVKGDNSKYLDGKLGKDIKILGVAPKEYRNPLLAYLSSYNLMDKPFSRFSRLFMLILGFKNYFK